MENAILSNARDLEQELAWFVRVVDTRFKLYFGEAGHHIPRESGARARPFRRLDH